MRLSCIEVLTVGVLEKYVQGFIGPKNHYPLDTALYAFGLDACL
jgi:hypothetical protein